MSDARAATDAVVDLCRKTAHERMPQVGYSWMAADRVLALCARISADAARIRELEARQVPDGWQVVPKEPTRAMHDASDEILSGPSWTGVVPPDCRFDDYVRKLEWAAMLAAAPRP